MDRALLASTLADALACGTPHARMPGFSELMRGPLDDAQVESLVRHLRCWGRAPVRPSAGAGAPSRAAR
jgi:hypothetical protein